MSLNETTVTNNSTLDSPYGYVPTRWVALIFLSFFGLSTVLHIGQAIHSRLWWLFPTIVLAGIGETAGWSGRLWSSYNVQNKNAFLLQIITTIVSPTPLLAATFVIHGRIVAHLGTSYSRLSPRLYSIIFVTCDVVTLVVQGVGGGIAASNMADQTQTALGGHIMLGGIAAQLAVILVYVVLKAEFFLRYVRDWPITSSKQSTDTLQPERPEMRLRLKLMTYGLEFSTLCLVIRGIYRVIELSDGWGGKIIGNQVYFNVLDGGMITLAIYTINFVHPGIFLPRAQPELWVEK